MTLEIRDLFHAERLSDSAISHLSDNVVLLNYIKEEKSISRAMAVIKSRASYHDPGIRQFKIGPDGIVLADSALPPSEPDADPVNPERRTVSRQASKPKT